MPKLPHIKKILYSWQFWLLTITSIAIFIRLIPAFGSAAWGNDFGIYYGLTRTYVETGDLFNPYYGWGSSYNQFPILYILTGGAHMLTGIDVLTIMANLVPIFGGLCIFVFYFVVNELTHDKKKSLLAAGLLAVLPFHVYQTSHAAPLTLGHFFLICCIYFFIKSRKRWQYLIPLAISTLLLIMTHHLTTYMLVISIIFIIFSENFNQKSWSETFKIDMAYLFIFSLTMFIYWKFFATIVYDKFMVKGLGVGGIGSELTIIIFYVGIIGLFSLLKIKRRLNIFNKAICFTPKHSRQLFYISMAFSTGIILIFSLVPIPWEKTPYTLGYLSLLWAIPLIIVLSLAVAGYGTMGMIKQGSFVRGWFLGLSLSMIGAILFGSSMEYHRHFEYLMMPIAIIAVYGLNLFLENYAISKSQIKHPFWKKPLSRDLVYILIIVLLIVGNGSATYPTYSSTITYHEDLTKDNINAAIWLSENVSINGTMIASDHRIERMAEAFGFNTTKNNLTHFWNTTLIDELIIHNISHVILDSYMIDPKNGVFSYPDHYYMTNESIQKFEYSPFELLYQNSTFDKDGIEIHWTRIYQVNWTNYY